MVSEVCFWANPSSNHERNYNVSHGRIGSMVNIIDFGKRDKMGEIKAYV
jgi:hypothetical protein